jgi:hypothetical protein
MLTAVVLIQYLNHFTSQIALFNYSSSFFLLSFLCSFPSPSIPHTGLSCSSLKGHKKEQALSAGRIALKTGTNKVAENWTQKSQTPALSLKKPFSSLEGDCSFGDASLLHSFLSLETYKLLFPFLQSPVLVICDLASSSETSVAEIICNIPSH